MSIDPVYLDSYTLQSDMRIRIPKSAVANLKAVPGKTRFSFYYDNVNNAIIMRICNPENDSAEVANTNGEGGRNG